MRQIRPRTSHPALASASRSADLFVDLRDSSGEHTSQGSLRAQLAEARQAVREATHQLATLIDERDGLKARLEGEDVAGEIRPDDRSIVPWAFYEEDAG